MLEFPKFLREGGKESLVELRASQVPYELIAAILLQLFMAWLEKKYPAKPPVA